VEKFIPVSTEVGIIRIISNDSQDEEILVKFK
jgi:hypothetical protein